MPEWEDKKALKLHQRSTLLKAFEAPVNSIPSVDRQNDISDYLDHCELSSSEKKKNYELSHKATSTAIS